MQHVVESVDSHSITQDLPKRLNLGCGMRRLEGYLNVDKLQTVHADLTWDLDCHPYPLPRNHFEHIHVGDVVEHLADITHFMAEVHELLVPGGTVAITTPHFSCANSFTDPTHRHHLGYFSFDYFVDGCRWNFYTDFRFEIVQRHIAFHHSLVNRVVVRLANRFPERYERRFAWMFPAWFLGFTLRALK